MCEAQNMTDFQYMDADSVDEELICTICLEPFIDPVTILSCDHTFCRSGIESVIADNGVCPLCRERFQRRNLKSSTRNLVNMLSKIPVICKYCNQANIERGYFTEHINKLCPKVVVSCSAANGQCVWKGPRDQLSNHLTQCTAEVKSSVQIQLMAINKQIHLMQCDMQELTTQRQRLVTNNQLKPEVKFLDQEFQNLEDENRQLKLQVDNIDQRTETLKRSIGERHIVKLPVSQTSKLENRIAIAPCWGSSLVDLRQLQLVDRDMPIVVNKVINNQQCNRLWLHTNQITVIGVRMLADAIRNNSTLVHLNLYGNAIGDQSVLHLKDALTDNTNSLRELGLGRSRITDKGAHHLAEMLKINTRLTWLSLEENEIGDRGVQLVAEALGKHNRTLRELLLANNKSVTDASAYHLVKMLQHNASFEKLFAYGCSLSASGKYMLRTVSDFNTFRVDV